MDAYLAPAFGGLVLLALGVLIKLLQDISGKLTDQGEKLVRLATVVGIDGNGLVASVAELKIWREEVREEEVRALRRRQSDL